MCRVARHLRLPVPEVRRVGADGKDSEGEGVDIAVAAGRDPELQSPHFIDMLSEGDHAHAGHAMRRLLGD